MTMNWPVWLGSGFIATSLLTTAMAASQGLGLSRINVPYILGTMFTPDRDRAKVYGFLVHMVNGWIFALIYVGVFHVLGRATWWFGALVGLLHSLLVLMVVFPLYPGIHPRMASEQRGPTVVRQLEPPGFLGLHYGARTPIAVIVPHVLFGAMLGLLYKPG